MTEFIGGITNAGRLALAGASEGSLRLGGVKIGSTSLTTAIIDKTATDISGNLELSLDVTYVYYTPFGLNKLVIFIELENEVTREVSIGNVMFFLDDGTPFAFGAFKRSLQKFPSGPDTGGDWYSIALNLLYPNITSKFTLNPSYSTEFALEQDLDENRVIKRFSGSRRFVAMANEYTLTPKIPGIMYIDRFSRWQVNPYFDLYSEDFTILSGGNAGDRYIRTIE